MAAMTGSVTMTSNYATIAKKFDPALLVKPTAKAIITEGVQYGAAYLKTVVPVLTGASRSQVHYAVMESSASILSPAHPLIFLERGSQAHIGPGARLHRRKSAKAFSSGLLRIQGRHFERNTRRATLNNLKTNILPRQAQALEQRFGSQ